MKAKYKMNKFLKQEFKRTFPLYILGVLFETITIYITLLNTQIIGKILDMILFLKQIIIRKIKSSHY